MRQSTNEKLDRGEVEPSLSARDRCVEVFGEAAVSIEPSKGAFDDPAAREDGKTNGVAYAMHDVDRPVAEFGERVQVLVAGVRAVGEELA